MIQQNKLLIFGSHVSRDILNFSDENRINLVKYFARSSIGSIYGKVIRNIDYIENLESEFQKRIVSYDLNKDFVENIGSLEYNLLFMDFIDERFDLYILEDSSLCTLSTELLSTDFLKYNTGRIVKSGSDEHYKIWEKGWKTFIEHLNFLGITNCLYIQETYWSLSDSSGSDYSYNNYSKDKIKKANLYLSKLYKRAKKDLSPNQFLKPSKENIVGKDKHKWGRSPFHYIDNYYHEILSLLLNAMDISQKKVSNKAYDPYALHYPVITYSNVDKYFQKASYINGIHHIQIIENHYLDIYISGLEELKIKQNNYILVGFNAAVSNRNGKRAPFFSGLGISSRLKMPIISIADPTLELDENLSLAWYAGNRYIEDLPKLISKILDTAALYFNMHLLLFGGSGGGFAALTQSTLLKQNSIVLVWNPQTSIENYPQKYVSEYDNIAFKNKKETLDKKNIFTNKVIHNICNYNIKSNIQILYLQNIDDWHLQDHALPYMNIFKMTKYGNATFLSDTGKLAMYFGKWGVGHIPPPVLLIEKIIKDLTNTSNNVYVAWSLDQGIKDLINPEPLITLNHNENNFPYKIDYKETNNKFFINCNIPIGEKLELAYYLLEDGIKTQVKWYSSEYSYLFSNINMNSKLEIIIFIKDIFGTVIRKRLKIKRNL